MVTLELNLEMMLMLFFIFQGLEKIAIEGTDLTAKEISAVMKLTQKYNQEGSG